MERLRFSVRFGEIPAQQLYYPGRRRSSLQIFFNLSYQVHHRRIFISPDGTVTILGGVTAEPVTVAFWSDIEYFKNKHERLVCERLSSKLTRLRIDSQHHRRLASAIIDLVRTMTPWISKKRKALPLLIQVEKIHDVIDRTEEMNRALAESRLDFEARNYGMVPTARKSRLLKCVKLRESEDCSICFEEISEFGASMPCSHHFHGTCILRWLENSHYCPICRFEMPTDQT
ncbi:hypothetical protein JCGZ_21683 [Jatropha curcas]|uniref:RING-type E3 ubiquitin transferase n=1 Tax=Jatropha curcas TaxID=180498 RepID=A0A067JBT0_JATCU|nr:LON peptidase N-terminal domain and RING finger protein C14F5.10c [Jatropha curcas]KDP21212.1 hypothetical protein JCGZ_21683 [Jatropha curcas]